MTRPQSDAIDDFVRQGEELLDTLEGCEDPAVVHLRDLLTETLLSAMSVVGMPA